MIVEEDEVPLYMDRHDLPGATAEEVAQAHVSDLRFADDFGVRFFSYWFDEDHGAVFCFARAPDKEAVTAVHQRSHGLLPTEIIEVSEADVVSFLGHVHEPASAAEITSPFRLIAFTDLVDSTKLLNQLGQGDFMVLLTEHDLILRRDLAMAGGREVKHTGDGIMASFEDVTSALRWSLNVRDDFNRRDDMQIRIGLAAGEPVDHNHDIFGAAVNLANRICGVADPGRVLVSDTVRDLGVVEHFEFGAEEDVNLKGFPDPQPVYELLGETRRDE